MAVLQNKKGYSITMIPIIITLLIGFMALGIDYGRVLVLKHQLQSAADAAAIAGASMLKIEFSKDQNGNFDFNNLTTTLVTQKAYDEAENVFQQNTEALNFDKEGIKIIEKTSQIKANNCFQFYVKARIPIFMGMTFLGTKGTQDIYAISEAQPGN